MILISQDRLKAIPAENIKFFTISPDPDKNGKFYLFAKPPTTRNDYYDYLILFEHENLNVVKEVMMFLANGIWLIPYDDDNQNLLVVDLPDLYKHGMKIRDFNIEKEKT
ncbi:MAG: hypothetical protein IJQ99_04930 [Synergistaceae bacterium]|nr:hypothetical protein [Synergistaceae bacterium]